MTITIPNNDRWIKYTASGGQTIFDSDFPVYAATDLSVWRIRAGVVTLLVNVTDYALSLLGAQNGCRVTLTSGATANDIIVLVGARYLERLSNFIEGQLRSDDLNVDQNRDTIAEQERARDITRAIRLHAADDPQSTFELPLAASRANKYLSFGASGEISMQVPAGAGTVTSVAMTVPASIFSLAGSPITGFGTLALALLTQAANAFFAGPSSGGAAVPAFRGMVAADVPDGLVSTAKIADDAVTNGKLRNSAARSVVGRSANSGGDPADIAGTGAHTVLHDDGASLAFRTIDTIPEDLALTGVLSPAQITANQNDYDPAGLAAASTLRLATDAARTLTGLAGGSSGRIILLQNVGPFDLVLADQDTNSSAANRFKLGGSNLTMPTAHGVILRYDGADSRWYKIADAIPGGAGGAPSSAQYVVIALDGTLTAERRLQVGAGLSLNDGGANGDVTLDQPWRTVKKTADEIVASSTTLQNDDHLFFAVEANKSYSWKCTIILTTPAAADWKYAFTGPAGASFVQYGHIAGEDGAGGEFGVASAFASTIIVSAAATLWVIELRGALHNGGTAGTVQLQWAQNASDAGNTTVRKGSFLQWMEVA